MYLEHADAMEKRTTELMKTVKDYDVSADKERLLEEVKKREGQREERKSDDVPNKRRTEVKQRIQFYHEHPYVTHKRSQKSAQVRALCLARSRVLICCCRTQSRSCRVQHSSQKCSTRTTLSCC